jgi:zinc transport system substrate-binding protein
MAIRLLVAAALLALADAAAAVPKVVATILPIHALVASVMEGVGKPTLLLPPTFSEHTAALTPSDARTLAEADVIVWVGEAIETLLAKPIRTLPKKTMVVTLSRDAGIVLLRNREGGLWEEHDDDPKSGGKRVVKSHAHGKADKHARHDDNLHIWLDPENAKKIARHVAVVLGKGDAANAARYAANAERTIERLDRLDAELRAILVPARDVPFLVFHDAFPYFENRYGLTAIGSITLSPEQKPGAKRVLETRKKLLDAKAVCVFSEPQYDASLLRNLVEGTPARLGTLDPIGSDIPLDPGAYESLMRKLALSFRTCLTPTS